VKEISIKRFSICIVAIGALILGGCGGSGNDTSTSKGEGTANASKEQGAANTSAGKSTASGQEISSSGPRLSFNERFAKSPANDKLTKEINAICTRDKAQGAQAMSLYLKKHGGAGQPTDQQLIDAFRASVVPAIETAVKEIRTLKVPADSEEAVNGFWVAMSEVVYTASKNPTRVAFINQGFEHIDRLARLLDLDACIYGPITAGSA
jgi:hypothetical protein